MSFINPIFLVALIGVSVPIIIHLTRNFKAKKIQFSSLMFLRATPKELIKKRRLRDLILLILRSILFALLAIAFARPFFQQNEVQIFANENERSIVLVIDQSFSMGYKNLFEQVKNKAAEIIDQLNGNDEISLISFSDGAQQITAFTADRSILKNALNQLRPNYRTTNFYQPMQLAEEILREAKNPEKQIILLSDFQDIGFNRQLSSWKLNSDVNFIPVQIAADDNLNSFINRFSLRQSRTGKNVQAEFKAEIGFAEEEKEKRINLWINNKSVDQKVVHLDQINQAFFQQYDIEEGDYQGFVELEKDALGADNLFYFTFSVQGLPEILCIDNSKSRTGSAFFLQSAFDLGDVSTYKFTSQNSNFINSTNLSKFQLLILTDLSVFNNSQKNILKEYVKNGGNIIVSFSDQSDLSKTSEFLAEVGVGQISSSAKTTDFETQSSFIAQVNFKHPIFSIFVESGAAEIYRPRFRKSIQIDEDTNSVVLAKYNSENPFLIETKFGKGKILTYTSTLNTSWTDFPVYEIYVPFIYQMANYLITKSNKQNSFLVGNVVLLEGEPNSEWTVENPENQTETILVDETGVGRFTNTDIPGNYVARSGNNRFHFSVNVDVLESNLTNRDVQEARAAFVKPNSANSVETATTYSNNPNEDEKKQKLWLYLILLILAIFMFESYYANRNYKNTNEK